MDIEPEQNAQSRPAINPPPRRRSVPQISAGTVDAAPPPDLNRRPDGSYIVGKNRPPMHTRWQKGQSGNARGRKKGTPNADTLIIEFMEAQIPVRTAQGEKRMSRQMAGIHRAWDLAAKGNLNALRQLQTSYAEAKARRAGREISDQVASAEERAMLDEFMRALNLNGPEDDAAQGPA